MHSLTYKTIAGAVAFALCSYAAGEEAPRSVREEIRAEMTSPSKYPDRAYSETDAEAFAEKYGKEATPVLLEMLKEDCSPRLKRKICFFLGKLEDSRAVQPMIDLFEASIKTEMDSETRRMMVFILRGLAYSGDSHAREFLKRCAGKDYWTALPVRPTVPEQHWNEGDTRKYLRKNAVISLGRFPDPAIVDTLEELKRTTVADDPYLCKKVDDSIKEARRRQEERNKGKTPSPDPEP